MLDFLLNLDTQLTLFFNGSDIAVVDQLAIIATKTITWIPLALVLLYVIGRSNHWKNVCIVVIAIALAITMADQVASGLFKPLVARLRPSHEPSLQGIIDIVNNYRGGRYGFFSSHAANTCAVATLLSLLFKYKPLTVTLYSWTLLNCWTRVYLGVHYVGDLLVGLIWGFCVGIIVYAIAKKLFTRFAPQNFEIVYTPLRAKLLLEAVLLTYLVILVLACC
ncbi:MAG: phosphatase PAP2 family protein [Bacteroidaceae bacterium]|nr:phosphatase PAP2 family protein [Bacteroidaceae bacterium]